MSGKHLDGKNAADARGQIGQLLSPTGQFPSNRNNVWTSWQMPHRLIKGYGSE